MRIADDWESRLPQEAGFYAFNDVHAAMAFAMAGRDDAMLELDAHMADAARVAGPQGTITPRSAFRSREGSRRLLAAGTPNRSTRSGRFATPRIDSAAAMRSAISSR